MWLYFKGIIEADKKHKKEFSDSPYTAEYAIGYTLVHYPLFIVELFIECIAVTFLIIKFGA